MTDKATDVIVTQADIDLAVRIANLCGVELDDSPDTMPAQWIADHRTASEQPASGEVEMLREAIQQALQCTPSIKISGLSKGITQHKIVYDCGDPWEILRAALSTTSEAPAQEDQQ